MEDQDPLHVKLEAKIEDKLHVNKSEHKETFIEFTSRFVFYALLGAALGGIADIASNKLRNKSNSKVRCGLILLLQLFVIGSIFFWLTRANFQIPFDDWLMETWTGFVFAITFFSSQKSLSDLIQVIFNES